MSSNYSFLLNFDIILQTILVLFGFFYTLVKQNNRFLILSIVFLIFNILTLYFLQTPYTSEVNKNIITYTISTLISINILHYSYYQFQITLFPFKSYIKYYIVLLLSFILLFILPYTITRNLLLAKELFLLPHLLFGLMYSISFFKSLKPYFIRLSLKKQLLNFLGILSILAVFIFAFLTLLLSSNFIAATFLNLYFYVISILFIYTVFLKSDLKLKHIQSNEDILLIKMDQFGLTETEKKMTLLLIQDPTMKYKEIASQIYVTENAVSSQLSKCFKKVGVKKKSDYIAVFK